MHRLLQFTLDLFDPDPPAPAPATEPQPSPSRKRPAKDNTPRTVASTTPEERLDQVLQPASFRHPRANREAILGDSVVAF